MHETYNYTVVRQFAVMTIVWGIVGMLVGVVIAAQLAWQALNFDIPWLTYGRLRPLHTNAVIFAFGGSALFATSYYVVQRTCHVRLFGRELYSLRLVETHFWVSTVGIVLYITSMWVAGIMQGLMWRAVNDDGTLTYSFVESVEAMHPFYVIRLLGGVLFFAGMVVMAWNLWKTVRGAQPADAPIPAPAH